MKKAYHSRILMTGLTLAMIAAPALADVKDGVDAWGRGDFEAAVSQWRGPAENGDADAQFNLAQAYKLGRGVPQDLDQAARWYKRAADQDHMQASDNYGLILFQNNRRSEALPYLQASAERGEPRAQYVLGTGHFNGDFVEKDWIKAYALMTRSSAQELPQATSNLAQMDRHISIEDRRRAIELAGQMEQNEKRVKAAQIAGFRPAQPAGAIETTQLPPSRPAMPAPDPQQAPVTPGVTYAPAPQPTPAVPEAMAAAPASKVASAPKAAPAPAPAASAPATSGDWRVQLGAFSDENRAKALWDRLENSVSILSGQQPYLVKAGGVTRLQAGAFATRAQANSICSQVKASGNDCIVKRR